MVSGLRQHGEILEVIMVPWKSVLKQPLDLITKNSSKDQPVKSLSCRQYTDRIDYQPLDESAGLHIYKLRKFKILENHFLGSNFEKYLN